MGRQKDWVFTKKKKESLKKAQRVHVELVNLGKRARERGAR